MWSQGIVFLTWLLAGICQGQFVFINEIHYDNSGRDTGEFVEVAAPAGTDLGHYAIAFYNGADGRVYRTEALSGVIQDERGLAYGALAFHVPGIQNGAPDGLALYHRSSGEVREFLSYEGVFTASGGIAAGSASVQIPLAESSSVPAGRSLQRQGAGREGAGFRWSGPSAASPGTLNANQTIDGDPAPFIDARAWPRLVAETAGPEAISLTIRLLPPPETGVLLRLSSSEPARLPVLESVTVPPGGVAEILLGPIDNELVDETSEVRLTIEDPSGLRQPATVSLTLLDDDRSPASFNGTLRVATYNVRNGVGEPSSPDFEAVKAILRRVKPDVIAFQETSSANDFARLKSLLAEVGYLVDRQFLAIVGEGFESAAPENGQFPSDQFIAIASRYPIARTLQIGRGVAGRRELARYPLYVEIVVPLLEVNPAFVAVHLKAGRSQSDQFRKAVEAYRIREFLQERGLNGRRDAVVMLGDYNENRDASRFQTPRFSLPPRFTDGSSLPAGYRLGADLADGLTILPYRTFPDRAFQSAGYRILQARHANGRDNGTFIDDGDSPLDYIVLSEAVRVFGNARAEVFSSVLDRAFDGLPKAGEPLPAATERRASDHRLVFADVSFTPSVEVEIAFDEPLAWEGGGPIMGHVKIGQARDTDLTGSLAMASPDIGTITNSSWTIPAGMRRSATVTFTPNQDGVARPDLLATVLAQVDRRVAGVARIEVRNREPSGRVLVSQYREPPRQTAGRALELYHAGAQTIDLSLTPLHLYRYANGSRDRVLESSVNVGTWNPGEVVVIGDGTTRTFLQGTGFLPPTAATTNGGTQGTAFTNRNNELVFVLDNPGFDGDDALEVQVGWERADVFGRIGSDPGDAWLGEGLATSDVNLTLSRIALFGSGGFDDPSGRFRAVAESTPLEGFGQPPLMDPTYRQWLDEHGVPLVRRDPKQDPDGDGFCNWLEFALLLDPNTASSHPLRLEHGRLRFSRRPWESLRFEVEGSDDLRMWKPVEGVARQLVGVSAVLTLPAGVPRFVRLRVSLF